MKWILLSMAMLLFACSGATSDPVSSAPGPSKPAPAGGERNNGGAAPAPTSTPSTWCTDASNAGHDFCADFDGDDALGAWDDAVRGNDEKHEDVDDMSGPARSGKGALHLHGDALEADGADDPSAYLWSGMFVTKDLPTTSSTKATIAFDLFVGTNEGMIGVVELSGRTSTGEIPVMLRLDLSRDASWLSAALDKEVPKLAPIDTGKWVRVKIAIDGAVAALSFDDVPVGSAPFDGDLASSTDTTLYLGISRTAPSGAYDVRFDDVVVDLH